MLTRIALTGIVIAMGCTNFATRLPAQSGQTVTPVPITPPSLNTTTLTCQINCDTQAMNCTNTCIPAGGFAVGPTGQAVGGVSTACTTACSSQQLVCKQRC